MAVPMQRDGIYLAALLMIGCMGLALVQAQTAVVPQVDILAQPGCSVGSVLKPNMQTCVINEIMGSNGTLTFTFNVASDAKHSVLFTLRSVGGAAVLRLYNKMNEAYNGQVVYYNDAVTESFLRVPASRLSGGQYTVVVQGMGGATQKILLYLRVQTPASNVRLATADKAALVSIMRECCPAKKGPMSPEICTTFLPAALNAKQPEDDLCNIGDFVCDYKGHLQKVDFSNAGLVCPNGFPEAFGKLPALETLMLRYNDFMGDTLQHVADVFEKSPALRRLMLGATNLTGTVPCALFDHNKLKTIMISINNLEGSLPDCVLASPYLEELYMSRTTLTGPLPDSFTTDSNLRVWYAINKDPVSGEQPGPGFTGSIPPSIVNSKGLAFVQLSNHQLTGGVPALPEGIRMFEAQSNALDGGIASPLPQNLVYLDVMNNSLTGPIPDVSEVPQLTLIDLSQNKLDGNMPASFGAAADSLVYMDMSQNKLGGNINPGTLWERVPQLQYLFMQQNSLEGNVPASLAASQRMVALNLAYNNLGGDLTAFSDAINPPKSRSPQKGSPKRKLQGTTEAATAHSCSNGHPLVAKKLFGSYEEYTAPNPAGWHLDRQNIQALATHTTDTIRRRVLKEKAPAPAAEPEPEPQTVDTPAAGGATTTVVNRPPPDSKDTGKDAPVISDAAPKETSSDSAPPPPSKTDAKKTTTQNSEDSKQSSKQPEDALPAPDVAKEDQTPPPPPPKHHTQPTQQKDDVKHKAAPKAVVEEPAPTAETERPADVPADQIKGQAPDSTQVQEPSAPASDVPDSTGSSQQQGGQQNDIGTVQIPTASALAGNSYLYLNMSNNLLTGGIPASMDHLEMFRSPANSTDPYDVYVFNRGGPDRTLDLTNNQLYGEFPEFIINQAPDLADACLCQTTFNVSDGNYLFCPTKDTLGGSKFSKQQLQLMKQEQYTCLVHNPDNNTNTPVSLASYLSKSDNWVSSIPPANDVVKEKGPRSAGISDTNAPTYGGGGSGGGLSGGAVAGIVIAVLAAVAILGSLAYFVGYKKFYLESRATSFKRGHIPDGPAFGQYPPTAYGAGTGAVYGPGSAAATAAAAHNGFDIETPRPQ